MKEKTKAIICNGIAAITTAYASIHNYLHIHSLNPRTYHWWNGQLGDFCFTAANTAIIATIAHALGRTDKTNKKILEFGLSCATMCSLYEVLQPIYEGNTFDWKDVVAYFAGSLSIVGLNKLLEKNKKQKSLDNLIQTQN